MTANTTFESTYPRYPFAPLVRLAIWIAARLSARSGKGAASGHGHFGGPADRIATGAA